MAALTKDTPLAIVGGEYADHPVLAATKIFEGAGVTIDAGGLAKNLVAADTKFAGFAAAQADNSAGASGDLRVRTRRDVHYRVVDLAGVAQANVGAALYMSDNATFTLTVSTNVLVGKVHCLLGGTKIIAKIEPNV